jgi:hypothetical protein
VGPCHVDGRTGRRTGRDPVVDDDHRSPVQRDPRGGGAIRAHTAVELGELAGLHGLERRRRRAGGTYDVVVDDPGAVLADRTGRELGVGRHTELADDDHVEWCVQRVGDGRRDRHAASRDSQDDDIHRHAAVECRAELASGGGAVGEAP